MATHVRINDRQFQQRVAQLAKLVPLEAKDAIRSQAAIVVEDLIRATKPSSKESLKKRIYGTMFRVARNRSKKAKETKRKFAYKFNQRIPEWQYYLAWMEKKRLPYVKRYRVSDAELARFAKAHLLHQGFMSAGWLGSGNKIGAKKGITNIVKRHRPKGYQTIEDTLMRYRITVENAVSYAKGNPILKRIMARVIQSRIAKLNELIKRIKQGKKYQFRRAA